METSMEWIRDQKMSIWEPLLSPFPSPPKSHSLYLTSNSTLTTTTTIHPATNNTTRTIPLGITRKHDLNNKFYLSKGRQREQEGWGRSGENSGQLHDWVTLPSPLSGACKFSSWRLAPRGPCVFTGQLGPLSELAATTSKLYSQRGSNTRCQDPSLLITERCQVHSGPQETFKTIKGKG